MIYPLLSTLFRTSKIFFIWFHKNRFCYLIPTIFWRFLTKNIINNCYLIILISNLIYSWLHFFVFLLRNKHKAWNYKVIGFLWLNIKLNSFQSLSYYNFIYYLLILLLFCYLDDHILLQPIQKFEVNSHTKTNFLYL